MNCFNSETFLNEAVQSVISQTYNNWELVFWDNKSTDNSSKIIKSFNDKRIKYYYANKHTKLYESRNMAIEKCSGELVTFLDCDDIWVDNKLEIQLSKFNENVQFVYGNYNTINKKGKIIKSPFKNLPSGYITNQLFDENFISIGAVMISKKLLENNLFNPKYNLLGDFELWIRLSLITKFISISDVVEHSRVHEKNTSKLLYSDWNKEKRMFYKNFIKKHSYFKFLGLIKYILRTEIRVVYEYFKNKFSIKY